MIKWNLNENKDTKIEKNPTTSPLVIPPKIDANVTSPADSGGNKMSTILP